MEVAGYLGCGHGHQGWAGRYLATYKLSYRMFTHALSRKTTLELLCKHSREL